MPISLNPAAPADIEIIDPRFRAFVLENARLEVLAAGFRWLEGPVWFADMDCLIFSDVPNDRVHRWSPSGGASVLRGPSGFENGHCRDRQGRLISCSHQNRCVTRTEWDGGVTVLATHVDGRRLNAPNDIVCAADGILWFSDPLYGILTDYEGGKGVSEGPPAVVRLDPQDGSTRIVADDFEGPNGLAFSPDGKILYVTETGKMFDPQARRVIRAFDVLDEGRRLGAGRDVHAVSPGYADGLKVDEGGRIWSSAGDGVHCLSPDGDLLGRIRTPQTVANLAFGGRHRSQLLLCASDTLYGLYTNVRGQV